MAYLVVTANGKELYRRQLTGPVTLGRSTECDLWLNDAGVSRQHCRIESAGEGWAVHDLGSRNGVFMHGERVTKKALSDGDVVRVGGAKVTFHEVGFVAARPAAPTRSSDPMAETMEATHPSTGPRPMPTSRAAMPGRDASDAAKESAPSSATPLPFSRPSARPIPVPQQDATEDYDDGERSQGLVRRWLRK